MEVFLWILAISSLVVGVNSDGQVPAMFVFGASLVDPGNNNNLITQAQANFFPHGIDFPAGHTGRFCNGNTIADYIAKLLGLPLIPPFNNPSTRGSKLLQGVNYGSAGSGILNDTGRILGGLFPIDEQIQNFQQTLEELRPLVRSTRRQLGDFLGKSLFLVNAGANDYTQNYLLPGSIRSQQYTLDAYTQFLIQQYRRQLKEMYEMGGRKFLVLGLGALGCNPSQIANVRGDPNACVEPINKIAEQFNAKVKLMLSELNMELAGVYFLLWDVYPTYRDIINHPSNYGFKFSHTACCGWGRARGEIRCLPLLECQNRQDFVFWDNIHPSDAFNEIIAKQAYQGNLQTIHPVNVKELVQL